MLSHSTQNSLKKWGIDGETGQRRRQGTGNRRKRKKKGRKQRREGDIKIITIFITNSKIRRNSLISF
jgi:hypothetical protein